MSRALERASFAHGLEHAVTDTGARALKRATVTTMRKPMLYGAEAYAFNFKGFLKDLKGMSGVSTKAVEEAASLLKSVDSGIKSLDDALKTAKVTKTSEGFLKIGDETVGGVNKILREGDLDGIVRVSGSKDIPITAADRTAFKRTVAETPEKQFRDVKDVSAVNKRNLPELDSTVENLDRMSNTAKANMRKTESNLFKYFKQGTAIALTIGVVYVGVDWISKATQARKGCWMLTTINGKTTSCKVQAYTCVDSPDGNHCSGISASYYNVTLVLMHIATLVDTDARKIKIAEVAAIPVEKLNEQLGTAIDHSYEKIALAIQAMDADRPVVPDICGITHDAVEKGKVPSCRMCSPTANPTATAFIDPKLYGDNITFECVVNPSIMDTISDVINSTGKNILEGIGGAISGSLKNFGYIGVAILVLVLLILLVVKVLPKKQDRPTATSTSDNTSGTIQRKHPSSSSATSLTTATVPLVEQPF